MTITELETLLKRAEEVTGCRVTLGRDSAAKWNVVMAGPPHTRDRYSVELGDCVALLKEWATPPKPKTLTFTVPTDECESILGTTDEYGFCRIIIGSPMHKAMLEALKPYQQPEQRQPHARINNQPPGHSRCCSRGRVRHSVEGAVMRLEHRHEWELEGDLAATVILNLAFIATVTPLGLESLELMEVCQVDVTFAMHGEDIVCDGAGGKYGQPANPTLPTELLNWFADRFKEHWMTPAVRQGFVDLLNETAIQAYYEHMAGAT